MRTTLRPTSAKATRRMMPMNACLIGMTTAMATETVL